MPPIPTPGKIARWIRARPRRTKNFKRLVAVIVVAGLVAVAFRPVSHRVKAWQARRLSREAAVLIDNEDYFNAGRKLQGALQVWPMEPEVWRMEARLLGRVGQNQEALRWWQKVSASQPLSTLDRRDFAAAALSARDVPTAEEQVQQLLAVDPNPTARDLLLAGTLANLRNYTGTALDYASKILADPTAGGKERLGADSLIFSNSPPQSPRYRQAYEDVVNLARNESDNASIHALAILARQTIPPADANSQLKAGLARPSSQLSTSVIPPAEIAERLENHPKSRAFHKMLAMELRARVEPQRADQLVDEAVKAFGKGDDETLIMLTSWLYTRHKLETILILLPPERATRNRQLFIQRADALAALGRYPDLQEMLLSEQSVIDPSMQHMFLAVVRAKLGEAVASENEWDRALDEADSLQKLVTLADYAEKNGALETADAAYVRAISKEPGLRSAYAARLRLTQTLGKTQEAHKIAKDIVRLWPEDISTKVREIYLRLLLDSSPANAKAAEEELTAISAENPWDQPTKTALSLARLRQGRMAAALEAAPQPGPGVPPSAPLAVAWAANGWKDKAGEEIQKLATVKLLPEERTLIAPVVADH